MHGVCALHSWPGKTAEKKYIFIVFIAPYTLKGVIGLVTIKVFIFTLQQII